MSGLKNSILPLGQRGTNFGGIYDQKDMQMGGGGKNSVWAPILTQQNTLFCIQSWDKPTEISMFYYKNVFSEDKPETS